MPQASCLASLDRFLAQHARAVEALHADSKCDRWGVSMRVFAETLRRSAVKSFGGAEPDPADVEIYLRGLHLEDLALACACAEGREDAWEFFVAHFREDLRRAASAMIRATGPADDVRARELADSLYAELYGVRAGADGQRKSLFEYFHGRSKLGTWLRAVLAQKQVDLTRASAKLVSLETEPGDEARRIAPIPSAQRIEAPSGDARRDLYLRRFESALTTALAALPARERLILVSYYIDQQTLAEIGKMVHEHESTISRQLDRTRCTLRDTVTESLRHEIPARDGRLAEPALDAAQIELAFEYAMEDWSFDLSQAFSRPEPSPSPDRSPAGSRKASQTAPREDARN